MLKSGWNLLESTIKSNEQGQLKIHKVIVIIKKNFKRKYTWQGTNLSNGERSGRSVLH